jgi:hypothetical protein
MRNREWSSGILLSVCVSVIAVASSVTPQVGPGRCGTAHYFLFQLLGYLTLNKLALKQSSLLVERSVPVVLNVIAFTLAAIIWYLRAPRAWFVRGLLAWTVIYLISYFFLFPMPGCP